MWMYRVTRRVHSLRDSRSVVQRERGLSFKVEAFPKQNSLRSPSLYQLTLCQGGTNNLIDVQNPSNLGQEPTDSGVVLNLKWRFSDSKSVLFNGGWAREQVITDLPSSTDISGAQQHLKKGAFRELHWHRVVSTPTESGIRPIFHSWLTSRQSEWAFVYAGRVAISAVNENGENQYEILGPGDIWFFPKGVAHGVQGLDDDNEVSLARKRRLLHTLSLTEKSSFCWSLTMATLTPRERRLMSTIGSLVLPKIFSQRTLVSLSPCKRFDT